MAKQATSSSGLTKAEQQAREAELAEARRRNTRRIIIVLCVLAVPLYLWAAVVISAHNK